MSFQRFGHSSTLYCADELEKEKIKRMRQTCRHSASIVFSKFFSQDQRAYSSQGSRKMSSSKVGLELILSLGLQSSTLIPRRFIEKCPEA